MNGPTSVSRRTALGVALPLVAAGLIRPALADAPLPTIRVAAPPTADVVPLIYALESGAFRRAGITLDFTPMSTGAAVSQGVAGGAIDVGYSSLSALIAGHARGVPFLLIAPAGEYNTTNPATVMLVRNDASFATGRDFSGKTIGVLTLKDMDALATAGWIDAHGGDSQAVKYIELPNPALLPALLDGRVDAFTQGEPWVTQALDSGRVRLFAKSLDTIALRFLTTGWFSTSSYIDANRDAIVRFARVVSDATTYANAHMPEMMPYLARYTKLEPAMIARAMRFRHATTLDPRLVQPMIDVCLRYHLISARIDARDLISAAVLPPSAQR